MRYIATAWWLATALLIAFIALFFVPAFALTALCLLAAVGVLVESRFAWATAVVTWITCVFFSLWWIAGPNELDEGLLGVGVLSTGAAVASTLIRRHQWRDP